MVMYNNDNIQKIICILLNIFNQIICFQARNAEKAM